MDPRLWDWLHTAPSAVYVTEIKLLGGGLTMEVHAAVVSESAPHGQPFTLRFRGCRDVHVQASDPTAPDEVSEALALYLGEPNYRKAAVVYTGATELSVSYHSVELAS